MAYIGGQITEVTYHHPTLGDGVLYAKSNETSTINTGGIRSDDEDNSIAGDGNAIRKMNIERWDVECTIANDSNDGQQLQAVVALAGDPAEATWTFTHINGTVYSGSGFPVGKLPGDLGAATFKLKVAGSQKLQIIQT